MSKQSKYLVVFATAFALLGFYYGLQEDSLWALTPSFFAIIVIAIVVAFEILRNDKI